MARVSEAQGGFSLIEVMIATAVLSIGMGGMSALMLSAAGGMSESQHETIAHLHADAMAATWQLSPLALEHVANPPVTAPLCFETDTCTDLDFSMGQYLRWRNRAAQLLPGGHAVVCRDSTPLDGHAGSPSCDGVGSAVSKVFWADPRKSNEPDGGVRRAVVRIPE